MNPSTAPQTAPDTLPANFFSSTPQTPAAAVPQSAPDTLPADFFNGPSQAASTEPDNGLGQSFKGMWETTGQPIVQAVTHPIDTARNLLPNLVNSEGQMIDYAKKVDSDPKSTFGQQFDAGLYLIPGLGPVLKQADELNAQGKHAEAYGQAAGILATIFGPKVAGAAKGALAAEGAEGASALAKPAVATSDNVSRHVNQHIGLQSSDLTKYGKIRPEVPAEIGKTVYDEAGFKSDLAAQKDAIQGALDNRLAKTQSLLQAADAITPPIDLHRILIDSAVDLTDELKNEGETDTKIEAVNTNLNRLGQQYGRTMTPSEATAVRNTLKPSTFDPNTSNVGARYAQAVYSKINDEIANSLSPADAAAFKENNRVVHNLIIARDAAGEKLTKAGMKAEGPIAKVGNAIDIQHPLKTLTNLVPAVSEGRDLQAGIKAEQAADALKNAPSAVVKAGKSAAKAVGRGAASAVPGVSTAALAADIIHGAFQTPSGQSYQSGDQVQHPSGATGTVLGQHSGTGKAVVNWNSQQ